jgi:hypothetical protein
MEGLDDDLGKNVRFQKKLLNYKELEKGIIGMSEKDAQAYVDKNAIWSATHLIFEQTEHDPSFLTVDK